jgi:hypothetical protein
MNDKIKELLESGIPSEFKIGLHMLCQIGELDVYHIVSTMKVSTDTRHPFYGLHGIGQRFPLMIMGMLFSDDVIEQNKFPRMNDWAINALATPDRKGKIRMFVYDSGGIDLNIRMLEKAVQYLDMKIQ